MQKTYNPQEIEQQWYETWEKNHYFVPSKQGNPYCIMIPPPNVTGQLHMGHGFQYALMDCLIRYHRMNGYDTHWQVGTDHAGIATQMVVERQLQQQNQSRLALGREKFLEKVWEWKEHSGNAITQQMRRMGISVDWQQERFTMDEGLSSAVNHVFVELYRQDLIYRGHRLVNWDPKLLTAISDLEVLSEPEKSQLWYIRYPIAENKNEYLVIATTRPETMLGDTAVAVHPQDTRYQHLIGKHVKLPLTHRMIPIIADEYVDPEFGTGCVKITPAHDFNDYAVGQRHQLPLINILTPDAKINEQAPERYQGLDRFDARKKIVDDLQQAELLEKVVDHEMNVPRGDRSGVIIEPYLTNQWYVKAKPLADPAIDAVKQGKIRFFPENWQKTYFQWLENIEDWCISRQLWWGHRIPAWYDENDNIYVGYDEAEVRTHYQLADKIQLRQDEDVLDTWFSSALWPFSTLGWPEQTETLKRYYPTQVLVSGFDIIFFWIARMVMMGLKFIDDVPFHEVYITGLIRDSHGKKMSKSKGNVLDPIDLVDGIDLQTLLTKRTSAMMQPQLAEKIKKQTEKDFPKGIAAHGTDALRFTFCALASTGRDIRFDMGRLEGYRNFCNKLWNASRYVLMNTENQDCNSPLAWKDRHLIDRWIMTKLQQTIQQCHEYFQQYRFDLLAQTLYDFTWNEYCDWYLELSKPMLSNDENPAIQQATRHTLITVLETLLRLLHPIIPFITEEIWQKVSGLVGKNGKSIMLETFPVYQQEICDLQAEEDIHWIKAVIVGIRTIRAEMNIAPNKLLSVLLHHGDENDKRCMQVYESLLTRLAKLQNLQWLNANENAPHAASAIVGQMKVLIPLAGLIDIEAETARLQKELVKLQRDQEQVSAKLANESFVANAPEDVIDKQKQRLAELENKIVMISQQLVQLQ